MSHTSFRVATLPDHSKRFRTIKRDRRFRATALTDEITSAKVGDVTFDDIDQLERHLSTSHFHKLTALAVALGVNPKHKNGWYRAFQVLAQATLGTTCLLVPQSARKDGARSWSAADLQRLVDTFAELRRNGMTEVAATKEIASASWIPYRPQRRQTLNPRKAKEEAVRKQLARVRHKQDLVSVLLTGAPASEGLVRSPKLPLSVLFGENEALELIASSLEVQRLTRSGQT